MLLLMLLGAGMATPPAPTVRAYAAISFSLIGGGSLSFSLATGGGVTFSLPNDAEGSVS